MTIVPTDVAQRLIRGKPWHHEFEIVPGVRTQGAYNPAGVWEELDLPADMRGLSLADVGASCGFFSFQARRQGARVVAFDVRHQDNSGFGLAQYINGLTDIEHHQRQRARPASWRRMARSTSCWRWGCSTTRPIRIERSPIARRMSADRLVVESYCIDALLPSTSPREPLMRFIADPRPFPRAGAAEHATAATSGALRRPACTG